jgi:hypothetical protein
MTKPIRVSWSGLRVWEECAMRSALQRDGKRAKVSNIRNFWPGMVVDHVMRVWLAAPTLSSMADLVEGVTAKAEAEEKAKGNLIRFRNPDDRADVQKFCVELCNRLEPILTKHVLPYEHTCGKWFKVPMILDGHDVLLTGEMDLLVQQPQGQVVWDLKGTADDQYYRKVVAQLTFYDLALWISTGKKTYFTGLIQPMCSERVMAWQITDEVRRNLMIRIQAYVRDIVAGRRECTDNKATCHWCDVKHACPRFSTTDALGDLADGLRAAAGETA